MKSDETDLANQAENFLRNVSETMNLQSKVLVGETVLWLAGMRPSEFREWVEYEVGFLGPSGVVEDLATECFEIGHEI